MTKTLILTLSKSQYVKKIKEEGRRKKHPHSILQAIILKITQDYTFKYSLETMGKVASLKIKINKMILQ